VGVLVPAGTSKDIISLLHREIRQDHALPDMKARLGELGYDPIASTTEEFATRIKVEIETGQGHPGSQYQGQSSP